MAYELKTNYGFDYYEVVSAFQKSIRRCLVQESIYWGIELYESKFGSSAWSRLMIIASEDIGLGNNDAIIFITDMHKLNTTESFICAIIYAASSPKSRIIDNLVCESYFLPHTILKPKLKEIVSNFFIEVIMFDSTDYEDVSSNDPKAMSHILYNAILAKDYDLAMYMSVRFFNEDLKAMYFSIIEKLVNQNSNIKGLKEFYNAVRYAYDFLKVKKNKHVPERLHFTHMMLVFLRPEIRVNTEINEAVISIESLILGDFMKEQIFKLRSVRNDIPDYALDGHTRRGKMMKRGSNDYFYVHSAMINRHNEIDCPDEWNIRDRVWNKYKIEDKK